MDSEQAHPTPAADLHEDEKPNFGKSSERSDSFDEEQYADVIN